MPCMMYIVMIQKIEKIFIVSDYVMEKSGRVLE